MASASRATRTGSSAPGPTAGIGSVMRSLAVSVSAAARTSDSHTMPTSSPRWSTTGADAIPWETSSAATASRDASGGTVSTGLVMKSSARIAISAASPRSGSPGIVGSGAARSAGPTGSRPRDLGP